MSRRSPWLPPGRVLLSNGPIRSISRPVAPTLERKPDAQILELLFGFPIFILDDAPFIPIRAVIGGHDVFIEKPHVVLTSFPVEGTLGNETPDAACTVVRVRAEKIESKPYPGKDELSVQVRSLLKLVRVKTR